LTRQTLDVLRRRYPNPEAFRKKLEETRTENLEKLLGRQLILHEFKTAGYNLPESVIDELINDEIRGRFGDRMTLTKDLHAKGISFERFRQQIRDHFIERALRQKNVSSEIIISPHKIDTYYVAHREEFKVEDEVKLRMLVLTQGTTPSAPSAQKLAEEILSKLNEGATFEEMEKIYSSETQRSQEGKWYERSQLTKGLGDVAFSVGAGKYSGVLSRSPGDDYWICEYQNGQRKVARHYSVDAVTKKEMLVEEQTASSTSTNAVPPPREYFLMLVEDRHAAHFKPLTEVRDQIEKNLDTEEKIRLEKQWIERLKKKTFVRYF
jgi:hypothetical protein